MQWILFMLFQPPPVILVPPSLIRQMIPYPEVLLFLAVIFGATIRAVKTDSTHPLPALRDAAITIGVVFMASLAIAEHFGFVMDFTFDVFAMLAGVLGNVVIEFLLSGVLKTILLNSLRGGTEMLLRKALSVIGKDPEPPTSPPNP